MINIIEATQVILAHLLVNLNIAPMLRHLPSCTTGAIQRRLRNFETVLLDKLYVSAIYSQYAFLG